MIMLALRNLLRNKKRSLIILSAVALSIGMVSFFRFFSYGNHQQTIWSAVNLSTGYLQIMANGYLENPSLERALEIKPDFIESLKNQYIEAASPRIQSSGLISFQNRTRYITISGINPEIENKITLIQNRLIQGVFFKNEQIETDSERRPVYPGVIGFHLAKSLGVASGGIVFISSTQYDGSSAAALIRITGIYKADDTVLDNSNLYISLNAARRIFGTFDFENHQERYTSIVFGVKDAQKAELAYQALKDQYPLPFISENEDRGESNNYLPVIYLWKDLIPGIIQLIDLDDIQNGFFIVFVALIVVFGIFNLLQMSIHERCREFGVLNAIGTKKARIVLTFFLEIMMIFIPGIIIGSMIGMAIGSYLENNPIVLQGEEAAAIISSGFSPVLKAMVDARQLILSILSVIVPSLIMALVAARRILKLNPIDEIKTR